jgi:hypothetical protein
MHDLIVFFDEAFSKVSGQDGGRTEVTRDGSSALGQERVAPAFERGGGGLGGGAIGEWLSSPPKFHSCR